MLTHLVFMGKSPECYPAHRCQCQARPVLSGEETAVPRLKEYGLGQQGSSGTPGTPSTARHSTSPVPTQVCPQPSQGELGRPLL